MNISRMTSWRRPRDFNFFHLSRLIIWRDTLRNFRFILRASSGSILLKTSSSTLSSLLSDVSRPRIPRSKQRSSHRMSVRLEMAPILMIIFLCRLLAPEGARVLSPVYNVQDPSKSAPLAGIPVASPAADRTQSYY